VSGWKERSNGRALESERKCRCVSVAHVDDGRTYPAEARAGGSEAATPSRII
jgi:hypothetical protein